MNSTKVRARGVFVVKIRYSFPRVVKSRGRDTMSWPREPRIDIDPASCQQLGIDTVRVVVEGDATPLYAHDDIQRLLDAGIAVQVEGADMRIVAEIVSGRRYGIDELAW